MKRYICNYFNKKKFMMETNNRKRAIIIGSGIAGLSCAIRLANNGWRVEIFEANSYPGGKLSEIKLGKYRFDAGPSLFTLPEQVEELFIISGENPAEHFKFLTLDKTCKYFFEDGTIVEAFSDIEKFLQEIKLKTQESQENIVKALNRSAFLYKSLSGLFMHRSLHKISTFFNKEAFSAYRNLHKLDFFRTMNESNTALFKDPKVVQIFNRYATYNGSSPYLAPATLNIIPNLEFNIGAYFPEKGMHNITLSLYELAKRKGVNFNFNSKVNQVIIKNKKATGIKIGEREIYSDIVVSNMDMVNTYKHLLPEVNPPKFLVSQPKSSSALIFYWGIKKSFPSLDLHNIFFSNDYQKEFDFIFNKKDIFEDPTIYINITSKYKEDDAPEGCENWFTMINVPHNSGQDWEKLIKKSRKYILKKLSRMLGENIEELIEEEDILDPIKIESKTSSFGGALYGNSSNNKYAAFLRHANFSRKLKNLYFCGGSVHPGGGIPLALLSGKITADLIN
jgi:phytoene desaturase